MCLSLIVQKSQKKRKLRNSRQLCQSVLPVSAHISMSCIIAKMFVHFFGRLNHERSQLQWTNKNFFELKIFYTFKIFGAYPYFSIRLSSNREKQTPNFFVSSLFLVGETILPNIFK